MVFAGALLLNRCLRTTFAVLAERTSLGITPTRCAFPCRCAVGRIPAYLRGSLHSRHMTHCGRAFDIRTASKLSGAPVWQRLRSDAYRHTILPERDYAPLTIPSPSATTPRCLDAIVPAAYSTGRTVGCCANSPGSNLLIQPQPADTSRNDVRWTVARPTTLVYAAWPLHAYLHYRCPYSSVWYSMVCLLPLLPPCLTDMVPGLEVVPHCHSLYSHAC